MTTLAAAYSLAWIGFTLYLASLSIVQRQLASRLNLLSARGESSKVKEQRLSA
jgi:hypothetical protein